MEKVLAGFCAIDQTVPSSKASPTRGGGIASAMTKRLDRGEAFLHTLSVSHSLDSSPGRGASGETGQCLLFDLRFFHFILSRTTPNAARAASTVAPTEMASRPPAILFGPTSREAGRVALALLASSSSSPVTAQAPGRWPFPVRPAHEWYTPHTPPGQPPRGIVRAVPV